MAIKGTSGSETSWLACSALFQHPGISWKWTWFAWNSWLLSDHGRQMSPVLRSSNPISYKSWGWPLGESFVINKKQQTRLQRVKVLRMKAASMLSTSINLNLKWVSIGEPSIKTLNESLNKSPSESSRWYSSEDLRSPLRESSWGTRE